MSGISRLVSKQDPCPICGKTDWCRIIDYSSGEHAYYCHRIESSHGDTVMGQNGKDVFICTGDTSGGFTQYQELHQYQNYIDSLKKDDRGKGTHTWRKPKAAVSYGELPLIGTAHLASPARLDEVYRAFLDLLILEDKHRAKLKLEWDREVNGENIFDVILSAWPIRSVPPEDFIRFSSKERLRNLSRKKIMEKLIEKVGEPVGVPGFYQRDKDRAWTFYRLAGIAYPCYNSHGQIVRIRINDDYPAVDGELDGASGQFRYQKNKETGWFFIPERDGKLDYGSPVLCYAYGSPQNRISLTKKGYPEGKVNGKYKNFSSFIEEIAEADGKKVRRNKLLNGCQSGSSTSLYTKAGDDRSVVYVTEGEKKAIVANAILHSPVISLPGVSSYGKFFEKEEGYDTRLCDEMKGHGMELSVLIFDADKNENEMVKNNEKKAVAQFLQNNLPIAIGQWNENWGKGLDDILLEGVKFKVVLIS